MLSSFLDLFQGKPAERFVWTADLYYWIAGQKEAGTAQPAWDSEQGYLELNRELGVMPYYYYEKFWLAEPRYSGDIRVSQEKFGNQFVNRIQTPRGTLTETSVYLPSSCTTGCTKHYVENEEELDVLLYLLEHRQLEPANLEDYPARAERWRRHGGLPSLGLPRSPLPSFVYEWAGLVQATYLLADCKAKVTTALRLMEEQEAPIMDALCAVRPPLVHFPDNLSSGNFSGYYDRYMAEPHARRLSRLHSAGIKVAVHLDGTVRGLLPRLVRVGFDAVEALTPAPAGDVTPEEMAQLVVAGQLSARVPGGNKHFILWGGVPGVLFAPPYTWTDMERHVRRVVDCWRDRPFVLGVADQVPPDGDITFCRRIADLLSSYVE